MTNKGNYVKGIYMGTLLSAQFFCIGNSRIGKINI